MKKFAYLALLSSSMLVTPAVLADTFTVNAPITEVTVYKGGGAQVTRIGKLTAPAGKHTLRIQGLHEEILSSSIPPQAAVKSGNATLSGMKLRAQPSTTTASERQRELMQQIKALEAEISVLKDKVAANDMRLAFIRNIGQSQAGQTQITDLASLEKALEFVGENTAEILADSNIQKQQIENLNIQRDALKRELKRSGPARTDYKQALIELDNSVEQEVTFTFSYFVENASWDMNVAASLDSSNEKLGLAVAADIRQNTGENWESVKLSLSNSRPSNYVGGINVPSQFISIAPENEMIRRMELKGAPAQMETAYSDSAANRGRVTASSSQFDRKYQVSGLSTILSNGETEKLNIITKNTDVEVITRIAPLFDRNAYVYADTELSGFLSIRNVNVNLSRDGHFAGAGRWPNLENNQELELPFGRNSNIEVTYTEQAPRDGDKGFINKKSVEEKRFLISVTNNGTSDAPVEVFDRYPVSAHEDIKIVPLKPATKPDEMDLQNKPGTIKWKKTLKPGETWYIKHEYQVTYPSDKSIRRMNR
ncbi:MAG: mucoidy inhibitor MuiA family protein [Kordiimonas sp.]